MSAAIWAEWLKLRRSRLPWVTLVASTIGVAVGALFMFIGMDPDRARRMGLLGAKAQLAAIDASWPGLLALLGQIASVGGTLIFGLTMVWMFGREFADHTAKDLLALPTSRRALVAAKFAVAGGWCGLLTVYIGLGGLIAGAALRLPGFEATAVLQGLSRMLITALLTIALTMTFGYASSAGRGYLSGVLAMVAVFFSAQIVAALGYGRWYPFSVPAVYSGLTGPGQPPPSLVGYAGVVALAVLFPLLTVRWWERTDHT
jgi:ABC-2 type transport system permease protein